MAKKTTRKSTKKSAKKSDLDQLNETGSRKGDDRRVEEKAVAKDRRKTNRRRQIDPTTCERDYTDAEIEFMHALDDYKRQSGRMFPTCSEILEVLGKLGYQKVDAPSQQAECCQGENESAAVPAVDINVEGSSQVTS